MKLFHYHYWTDRVEETEQFYTSRGFQVTGRFAKGEHGIVTYHPPLTWEDFRSDMPAFRIIEAVKGKINVTFGAGKKPMFDHIGFLVTPDEHESLCTSAEQLGWKVNAGDRRTFIGTPLRLRIELQQNPDAVHVEKDEIKGMTISVPDPDAAKKVSQFLEHSGSEMIFKKGERLALEEVRFGLTDKTGDAHDPNGVNVRFETIGG